MSESITVVWLVGESDVPAERDDRFRHVVGDPARPAGAITRMLREGAVLAVVNTEEDARRAIAEGADEAVLRSELSGAAFEKAVELTQIRARARFQRDLFLIDLVRKDDTTALALFAAALGNEIVEPLSRAAAEGDELVDELLDEHISAGRVSQISETVAGVAQVVERMRQLVETTPRDEVVDLVAVAREVCRSLAPAVRRAGASFEVELVDYPCPVGLPRWQAAMMIASLAANSLSALEARPEGSDGGHVAVRVLLQDGAALLEVTDDGPGMEGDVRSYAADPFFTTSGKGHHGLGLTLVTARVRRAGGEVVIETDPGVGTAVRVFLPTVGGSGPDGVTS